MGIDVHNFNMETKTKIENNSNQVQRIYRLIESNCGSNTLMFVNSHALYFLTITSIYTLANYYNVYFMHKTCLSSSRKFDIE